MPVSLDEMMTELPLADRAAIERDAFALAADHRRLRGQVEPRVGNPSPLVRVAVGTKAATGQPCPESGIWKVEDTTSATAPIAVHHAMPLYGNRAVTWVLIQHA